MIQEILTTKIFVVDSISNTLPPSAKDRICYEKNTKKLKIYDSAQKTWVDLQSDAVIFAENFAALEDITGSFNGQIGIDGENNQLYIWSTNTWVAVGGSGSIILVANKEALPADAEAGDIAVTQDKNIIYYYSGSEWISTQEKINIDYVYVSSGNITAGMTIENKTNQEMWELLLTKEINPSITQPSLAFTMSGASNNSLQEIGAQLNLTFTASFNRGTVKNAWGSNDIQSSTYSGLPNTYSYTGTGLTSSVSSTALSNQQVVNPYSVVSGAQSWTASVSYDAGTYQPKTNYGNNYGSTCPAGSKSGGTLKITGVYPTFATSVDLSTSTKQALKQEPANSSSYITFTLAGESSEAQRQYFELPSTWPALTGVADSGGAWYNGGKSGSVTQWTVSDVQETVQGSPVNYKRYTYNGPLSAVRTIRVFTK